MRLNKASKKDIPRKRKSAKEGTLVRVCNYKYQ